MRPIGYVRGARQHHKDDDWGDVEAEITLVGDMPEEALVGLEAFSHAEIIFLFDQVDEAEVVTGIRRPRNNPDWPAVGIFAQRGKNRPNRLGLTTVRVLGVHRRTLRVADLDALDGTPVLDIKPVMAEFLPRTPIRQPSWSRELMGAYWHAPERRPAASTTSMMILIAGPYRSGTGDDPEKMAANVRAMEALALPLFQAGHIPMVGEWLALPLVALAGSTRVGDAAFDSIFHPVAERLLARCDAVLRVGGASAGADEMVRIAREQGKPVFFRLEDVPGVVRP